jgi:hypothetical protein
MYEKGGTSTPLRAAGLPRRISPDFVGPARCRTFCRQAASNLLHAPVISPNRHCRGLGTGAHNGSRLGSNRALANPAGPRQPSRRPGRCTRLAQALVPELQQLVGQI